LGLAKTREKSSAGQVLALPERTRTQETNPQGENNLFKFHISLFYLLFY